MLLKAGVLLLAVWFPGIAGLYGTGKWFHVFLLVGLMLIPLAFARGRDAAMRPPPSDKR